ncbi:MAG: HD domain-containing protein [Eubacterium sp.]|nr:HD domain-containing protein [Eubacterium sp.]
MFEYDDVIEYIKNLFEGNVDGHDLNHSIRVYKMALKIGEAYPEADKKVIAYGALLHDVDDHKLFDTENNKNARDFLRDRVEAEMMERICQVINSVSFSKNKGKKPETLEACIVQDADRLDAMGAIGVARTFAYGGRMGRSMEESAQHFYDKLLKLKDMINTSEAMKIARERHKILEDFIKEFQEETGL